MQSRLHLTAVFGCDEIVKSGMSAAVICKSFIWNASHDLAVEIGGIWYTDGTQRHKGDTQPPSKPVRDVTFVRTASFSPTHQTLHRHPRSPPTALCCLTLSGYRCLRTKMASFQLVLWLFHLKCQSKSWNTGGGVVSEGRLSWCSLNTPTVWFAGLSLSEATARTEIWRPIDPTCRGHPSQNKSSCEDQETPNPGKSLTSFILLSIQYLFILFNPRMPVWQHSVCWSHLWRLKSDQCQAGSTNTQGAVW